MISISKAAKKFGLSRSTLLYYDSIGILTASARTESGYRKYSDADIERLRLICRYRQMGLPLKRICELLDSQAPPTSEFLEGRLRELNKEIQGLRFQQAVIVKLLKKEGLAPKTRLMDKRTWVTILRATGFDDSDMRNWHREFERISPESHHDFLESLQITPKEIIKIREWSAS